MKAQAAVLELKRLRREHVGWQLLASDLGPVALGLLGEHLFGETTRLPATLLLERLRRDLAALRDLGEDLPQTAEAYLAAWLRSGYVERRLAADAAEEEYELSAPAIRALEFARSLGEARSLATESRLSLVVEQLRQLAERSETDPEKRLATLTAERERLDREIEAVRAGHIETLSEDQALERTREVLALARELGNDFRRVREEFQRLNRGLREQLLDSDRTRGDVLEQLFAGVDVIAEAEAGRSFRAFWRLLTDPEQSATLDSALERILSRGFVRTLDRSERQFLLGLTRTLLDRGGEVHDVLQHFARSLKQFVQSQEFREQRRLMKLLDLTQRRALSLREALAPTADVGHSLWLTSAQVRSIGQWRLKELDELSESLDLTQASAPEISLEAISALVAGSEIDFRALRDQLRALLRDRESVTLADVLARFPARQGLGTVVGLVALGLRHGLRSEETDLLSWTGSDGRERRARVPRLHFPRAALDELA